MFFSPWISELGNARSSAWPIQHGCLSDHQPLWRHCTTFYLGLYKTSMDITFLNSNKTLLCKTYTCAKNCQVHWIKSMLEQILSLTYLEGIHGKGPTVIKKNQWLSWHNTPVLSTAGLREKKKSPALTHAEMQAWKPLRGKHACLPW